MKNIDTQKLFIIYFIVIQVAMVVLKLTGVFEINWLWVFWPFYVILLPATIYILVAAIRLIYNSAKALKNLFNEFR